MDITAHVPASTSSPVALPVEVDLSTISAIPTLQHWVFPRTTKYSPTGVVRSVRPSETIRRARAVMSEVGISKISDVTELDTVGIPNFMSVRPRDGASGISYYNGKGTTRADAHAGALMEAIERHGGEHWAGEIVVGSFNELRRHRPCVSPFEIIIPSLRDYDDNLELEWVAGFDLITKSQMLVPLNCVVCPYVSEYPVVFYASSNGLASGNSLLEALCHALCEVVERDAQAIAMARAQLRPALRSLLGDSVPHQKDEQPAEISLKGLPRRAQSLVERLRKAGLQTYIRDITPKFGIATIDCTIVQTEGTGPQRPYGGCGCHPDSRVALLRAITEAAQSRLTCIQGGREDLPEILARSSASHINAEEIFGTRPTISFSDIPSNEFSSINDDVDLILEKMPSMGLRHAIAFDLTRHGVGIPVVRVVVPRSEAWSVYHVHIGRAAIGPRIVEVL
jgi:YcaO-like protein with predicted kinase domain